jgi:hypothetical protein
MTDKDDFLVVPEGHTPGPWIIARPGDDCEADWLIRAPGRRGTIIATVTAERSDEARANALLIAAAPKLKPAILALLKAQQAEGDA